MGFVCFFCGCLRVLDIIGEGYPAMVELYILFTYSLELVMYILHFRQNQRHWKFGLQFLLFGLSDWLCFTVSCNDFHVGEAPSVIDKRPFVMQSVELSLSI